MIFHLPEIFECTIKKITACDTRVEGSEYRQSVCLPRAMSAWNYDIESTVNMSHQSFLRGGIQV